MGLLQQKRTTTLIALEKGGKMRKENRATHSQEKNECFEMQSWQTIPFRASWYPSRTYYHTTTVMDANIHCTKRNQTNSSCSLSLGLMGGTSRWPHHDKRL